MAAGYVITAASTPRWLREAMPSDSRPSDAATYYAGMRAAWARYPSTDDLESYEAFFAEMGGDRSMAELVRTVMAEVPASPKRVLEFGCDNGILLTLFRAPGRSLSGVDINPQAIARGRALFADLDLRVNAGVAIPSRTVPSTSWWRRRC